MGSGGSARAGTWRGTIPGVLAGLAVVAVALAGTAAGAAPAAQADPAGDATAGSALDVVAVDTTDYPAVGLTVVAAEGRPEPETVSVTQGGEPRPATITALADRPLEVVVVVDTSERVGEDLRSVVAAVTEFALRLPADAEIGAVAAGGQPEVAIAPTGDTGAVLAALAELEAGGQPAAVPAVGVALDALSGDRAARRAVVVVVAGAGTGEPSEELAARFRDENAMLFAVAASREAADLLAGVGASVEEVDDLEEAAAGLRQVAENLDGLYRLEFTAEGSGPTEIAVSVGDEPSAQTTVPLPAGAAAAGSPAGAEGAAVPSDAPERPGPIARLVDRHAERLLWVGYALGGALLLWLAWALDERRARTRRRWQRRADPVGRAASYLRAARRGLRHRHR